MSCSNCGTPNPEGAAFCGNCGQALAAPTAAVPPVPPIPPIPPTPPTVGPTDPTVVGAFGAPPVPPTAPPDATATFAVPPSPAEKKSKRGLIFGLIALLVVAGVVGTFLVLGGSDDDDSEAIVLEPIGQTLADDFAGNLDLVLFDDSLENVAPDIPDFENGVASVLSARTADGDTPGLYGGSRDAGTCDISQLIDFLTDEDNIDKAEAWADVQGIDVDEIEDFIDDLTPVRLRYDTRVTNHGFTDGAANPIQSVLEAGTAVLVDDRGVPRVKCNCGNPLAEPLEFDGDEDAALDEDVIQNPGDAWDDFDPEVIVVILEGDRVDDFTLVDIETGDLFLRPVGSDGDDGNDTGVDGDGGDDEDPDDTTTTTEGDDGGDDTTTTTVELGTGDVQVTLRWNSGADLDLAVTDPTGDTVSFSNRGPTATGGQLDVDANAGCSADADSGVENVFWPPGGAPSGDYTATVNGFSVDDCGSGEYELTISVAGQDDQVFQGSVATDEADPFEFTVP